MTLRKLPAAPPAVPRLFHKPLHRRNFTALFPPFCSTFHRRPSFRAPHPFPAASGGRLTPTDALQRRPDLERDDAGAADLEARERPGDAWIGGSAAQTLSSLCGSMRPLRRATSSGFSGRKGSSMALFSPAV